MTRDEIIKGLDECANNRLSCGDCPYIGTKECFNVVIRDALALLKEQEPVDPIPTEDDDWICGACNNSVVVTEELDAGGFVPIRFNYCPNCGQAVKWK